MEKYKIFKESKVKVTPEDCYLLQFDGLAFPNPGQTTGGAVLFDSKKKVIFEAGEYMNFGTNNQGEYTGFFIGIKNAIDHGVKNILIEGDSMLVIQQVLGVWKVNNEILKILWKEITKLLKENFDFVGIRHIYRKDNSYADKLTNTTLQLKKSFVNKFI
jgi:ribonuclease HI